MKKSFTLIELLVVMSIILILAAIILPSYSQRERLLALQRSISKLAQDLRRAQELATSAKEFHFSIPKGGYGIYFKISEPDYYILFADCDGEKDYDKENEVCPDCSSPPCLENVYPEKVGDNLKFEKGISIQNLSPIEPSDSSLTIVFTPPNPIITINHNPDISSASITLSNNLQTKTITINKAGLIKIE
ncbi:MAG: prepilin-type N-terminal cleavage/methylation domain-containing protein [Patescibacteria group bacterium]|nr:prepilin-type N-terminal cleavage/methylation domain-containing protein [Patescibacteria group bacterium]